jgi:hypothetical protein
MVSSSEEVVKFFETQLGGCVGTNLVAQWRELENDAFWD